MRLASELMEWRSVVVAELGDQEAVAVHLVDHAVFVIDASRPVAREGMTEGFGLADSVKGGAAGLLDEKVDPLGQLGVCSVPVQVMLLSFPCVQAVDGVH